MYLKHLHIHGFKTFAEKTQIVFNPGITCIVGPNGSGKSNITDAVLWVLGENNVRELRGTTSQDVIFAGNDRRRPLGMAEVSLTIDNSERILPLDFTEITVTRRLYRSGESECRINNVACRLRDIYELFLDTGVGRDGYSQIGQGEIDQILSVRSEDRRAIFEEAAGIKKYRVRKREAERKLENTQQNLVRVHDIIGEIEGQLGPLQRQANAARRYRELAGRLRLLEHAWYGSKLTRLTAEREQLTKLVAELTTERKRLEEELSAAQAEEKAVRKAQEQLDQQVDAQRQHETGALQRIAAAETEKARAEERSGEVQRRLKALAKELEDLAHRIEEQVRRAEEINRDELQLKRDVDGLRGELSAAQVRSQEAARVHQQTAAELERRRQAWLARARREAELEARLQSTAARVQGLEQQRKRAAEALEDGEAEQQRLHAERESFLGAAGQQRERAQALQAELEATRAESRKTEEATASARSVLDGASRSLQTHRARLQALTELGERGEGAAAGARKLLEAVRRGHVKGKFSLLVEGFSVPAGMEKAVEAALGVYGDALLCDTPEHALNALRWLRNQKATALILPGLPSAVAELVAGSLGESIGSGDAIESPHAPSSPAPLPGEMGAEVAWARHLLAGAFLVETLDAVAHSCQPANTEPDPRQSAPAVSTQQPANSDPDRCQTTPRLWVTKNGEWRSEQGALSGGPMGAEGSAGAALARRRELDRLTQELPGLEAAVEEARERVRKAEAEAKRLQNTLREKQSQSDAARLEHQAQLREADRRKADVERAGHRVERLKQDLGRAEREYAGAQESVRQAQEEKERLARGEGEAAAADVDEATIRAGQERVAQLETERRTADAAVADLRVRMAQQEQRLQGVIAAGRRAAEAGVFLDRQRADRLKEQRTLIGEGEQRTLTFATLAQEVTEAQAQRDEARATLGRLAEERLKLNAELERARARGADLQARLRELMERSHRVEVELTAVNTQRQALGREWLDAAAGAHSLEAEVEAGEGDGDGPEQPLEPVALTVEGLLATWNAAAAEEVLSSYSDAETEVARLRRQIRSLGPVNPDAVEQYEQAKERYDFLTTQRADLESAREQLESAIREIDAASRETFLRAFQEIAAAFDVMFKKLFGGGTTELRLTNPQDVLETGIDVIVQPPGKKQQNLLLLSGGERALTASAMLFALLTVRPSPFCVMDEIDAPLDETNVRRFIDVLKSFAGRTQFIMVTHNRGTMEGANQLYGVTMEERGVSRVLSCTLDDPVVAATTSEHARSVAGA